MGWPRGQSCIITLGEGGRCSFFGNLMLIYVPDLMFPGFPESYFYLVLQKIQCLFYYHHSTHPEIDIRKCVKLNPRAASNPRPFTSQSSILADTSRRCCRKLRNFYIYSLLISIETYFFPKNHFEIMLPGAAAPIILLWLWVKTLLRAREVLALVPGPIRLGTMSLKAHHRCDVSS